MSAEQRSVRPRTSSPWVVVAVALLFTFSTALFVLHLAHERDAARFTNAVQNTNDRIRSRLDVYQAAIRGTAALFSMQGEVDAEQFRRYVMRLRLQELFPGIQGIGWSERVAVDTVTWMERHAIRYLEPLDARNAAAIGFDMFSEPTRRAAMAHARDAGHQAMSGKVTLVQEITERVQAGFLIYTPVYSGGGIPQTVEERRQRLRGFAYSPFRVDDLFRGIFGSEGAPRVSFRVYDGVGTDSTRLLHSSPRTPDHNPRFQRVVTFEIAERPWTVVYESEPAFDQTSSAWIWFVAFIAAGLLASSWLFWFSRGQHRARAQAEAASRAKGDFLAVMSHELRTPLNAIGGYVDLMLLGVPGPVNEKQRDYLERIQRAQHHLLGLINAVLNYSKLEARRVEFNLEALDVARTIGEAQSLIAPQITAAGLEFINEGGPPLTIRGDADKVRQILLNLFSNAVKFTPEGSVTVSWEPRHGCAEISVNDTGIGIPADRLATIFDPFVQVDADLTRVRQGTGLGLSIARELARGMDGDLKAKSEIGRGSTFVLELPCVE